MLISEAQSVLVVFITSTSRISACHIGEKSRSENTSNSSTGDPGRWVALMGRYRLPESTSKVSLPFFGDGQRPSSEPGGCSHGMGAEGLLSPIFRGLELSRRCISSSPGLISRYYPEGYISCGYDPHIIPPHFYIWSPDISDGKILPVSSPLNRIEMSIIHGAAIL